MPESALLDLSARDVSELRWEDAVRSITGQSIGTILANCHHDCHDCGFCHDCHDCGFCHDCHDCGFCHDCHDCGFCHHDCHSCGNCG